MERYGSYKGTRHARNTKSVSFGDEHSGTITTVALRKTAEMGQEKYPKAAKMIKENTYMEDTIESVSV